MVQNIAVITQDGKQVSSHFGMADQYYVFHVEDGKITGEEQREKPHHGQHPHGEEHEHGNHDQMHADMFAPIRDCQVLISGGMGTPAYEKAQAAGLEVVLAGGEMRQAVERYLRGEIVSDMRRIHRH